MWSKSNFRPGCDGASVSRCGDIGIRSRFDSKKNAGSSATVREDRGFFLEFSGIMLVPTKRLVCCNFNVFCVPPLVNYFLVAMVCCVWGFNFAGNSVVHVIRVVNVVSFHGGGKDED